MKGANIAFKIPMNMNLRFKLELNVYKSRSEGDK